SNLSHGDRMSWCVASQGLYHRRAGDGSASRRRRACSQGGAPHNRVTRGYQKDRAGYFRLPRDVPSRASAVHFLAGLLAVVIGVSTALAADDGQSTTTPSELVKQANAPISSVFQIRFQDTYAPEFSDVHGQGNTFSIAMTMPLPEYRLLPFPQ